MSRTGGGAWPECAITHPLTFFQYDEGKKGKESLGNINSHPLQTTTLKICRDYYKAVTDFDRLFFRHYDHGRIEENEVLKENIGTSRSKVGG